MVNAVTTGISEVSPASDLSMLLLYVLRVCLHVCVFEGVQGWSCCMYLALMPQKCQV